MDNKETIEAIDEDFLQFLQCGICCADYDDKMKKPHVLECGHTICLECLHRLYEINNIPKCPFDNLYFTSIPSELPVNYVLLNMISTIKANQQVNKRKLVQLRFNTEGDYEGEIKYINKIPIRQGIGTMKYDDGREYCGDWKDNAICGHGKMKYLNGDVYSGEWANNSPNGKGTYTYYFGNIKEYIGTWKNGKGFGFGKIVYENGSTKETIYHDGIPCCNIIKKTYSDNTTFLGTIENNEVIGNGYEITQDGHIYIGSYKIINSKEERNGSFIVYLNNGDLYIGNMINNNPQGSGEIKYNNGDSYKGELYNYKKEGNGMMLYVNKDCYEGEWRGDMRNGKGTMKYNNNSEYNGEWQNDKRHGTGKLIKGTYTYDGYWINDQKNGTGIEIMGNGELYCGDYKKDKREGQGILTYKTGEVYKGSLRNNVMDGFGLLLTDNKEISGTWSNGMLIETKEVKQNNCLIF